MRGAPLKHPPADAVEWAEYRRQEPIEYRLMRDGKAVALATYASTGHGRWLLEGVHPA